MILHSEVIRQMLIYLQMIETEEDKVKFASIYDRYRDYMLTVGGTSKGETGEDIFIVQK